MAMWSGGDGPAHVVHTDNNVVVAQGFRSMSMTWHANKSFPASVKETTVWRKSEDIWITGLWNDFGCPDAGPGPKIGHGGYHHIAISRAFLR
jgi:hypothetical protein